MTDGQGYPDSEGECDGMPIRRAEHDRPAMVQHFSNELLFNAAKIPFGTEKRESCVLEDIPSLTDTLRSCALEDVPSSFSCTSTNSSFTDNQSLMSSMTGTGTSPLREVEKELLLCSPMKLENKPMHRGAGGITHLQPVTFGDRLSNTPMGFDLQTPEASDDESSIDHRISSFPSNNPSTLPYNDFLPLSAADPELLDAQLRLLTADPLDCRSSENPNDYGHEKPKSARERKFNTRLFKTELCRSWTEFGFCPYGPRCQFAHGKNELRHMLRHKKYKTLKCKNYQAGYCPYGTRCCFIHEQNVEKPATAPQNSMQPKPSLRGYHSTPLPCPRMTH